MPKTTLPTRLLTAMMATGLMLATTTALAQSTTRAEERRAERAKKNEAQADKPAPRYAGATRQEPDAKASRSGSSRLGKLSDAYEAQDLEKSQALANEIIADEKSNSYDKSMAARIAGAALLGARASRAFPWGTLVVNVAGSFLVGLLPLEGVAEAFVITGCLGGLTTFSTFACEALRLHESGRAGLATAYLLSNVLLGLGAVALGRALAGG